MYFITIGMSSRVAVQAFMKSLGRLEVDGINTSL